MDNEEQKRLLEDILNDDTVEQLSDSAPVGISDDGYNRDSKGKFGKGNIGCKTPAPQKTTQQMKEWLMQFISDKTEDMYEVFDQLAPKDKAACFLTMVKFVMPVRADGGGDQSITITMKPAEKKEYPD